VKLHLIYVDQLKTEILEKLAALPFRDGNGEPSLVDTGHGQNNFCFRFSDTLPEQFFGQCANEVGRTVWVYNRPVTRYQPLFRGARTEAIDCLVYGMAALNSFAYINWKSRAERRGNSSSTPGRTMNDFARLGSDGSMSRQEEYRQLYHEALRREGYEK
jgi:phage terminase large subunit GpA-like protein